MREFLADVVQRRNKTPCLELHPWFESGPEVLKELDAAARSDGVKEAPRNPSQDPRVLADRLADLDRHIARRLDRIALADLAPGNLPQSHEHFVGRHKELRELHDIMLAGGPQTGGSGMGGRGLIAAAFAPGGLGKTALARQYAHAYAEFYAAGGRWEISCEGKTELGAALLALADSENFRNLAKTGEVDAAGRPVYLAEPLNLSDEQRGKAAQALEAIVTYLRRATQARVAFIKERLRHSDRHAPDQNLPELDHPRALLLLDNVDKPELLDATALASVPAGEWLEIIVTTRLDPAAFGSTGKFAALEINTLPEADALNLLRDFQPDRQFPGPQEEAAAREIVRRLGGYTLAVELVGAYLGDHSRDGYLPSQYLDKLKAQGLASVDRLAGESAVAAHIRHSQNIAQNHIGALVRWSLERLSPPARAALEFASFLQPDEIPLSWLEMLTRREHPEALAEQEHEPPRWPKVWRELHGLRLLHPAHKLEPDDHGRFPLPVTVLLHRLLAEHVRALQSEPARTFAALDRFLDEFTTLFEQQVGQGEDAWLRAQHPWLRDQLQHILATCPPTATLLQSAQVMADYEGIHGSLLRGIEFFE
ncbi:MAG: hypothetical protein KIT22_18250, partial [Verrucomicrobiae bacterium]|nr:hypothetical protein [Verrucomicrobiae bacterium]